MLFKCFECGGLGFTGHCPNCREEGGHQERPRALRRVPIDPALLPEFQYSPSGFFESVLPPIRRKSEEEWRDYAEGVLQKYRDFREPYFVNFLHVRRSGAGGLANGGGRSSMEVLEGLLVRQGFEELEHFDGLVRLLIRSTALQQQYSRFARRAALHVGPELSTTLRSWIEERGTVFRSRLPLMVYFFWDQDHHRDEIDFSAVGVPLVRKRELRRLYRLCDEVHFDVLVDRLRVTLEQFDPSDYVTMYDVDAMSGTDFESFVEDLFRARGFEVRGTQSTRDQGADVFAERFGQEIVVQVKNYQGSVGNAAVQQAISAREFYSSDRAMVLANSRFTSSARQLADSSDVTLVGRKELQTYLDDYNRYIMEASRELAEGGSGAAGEVETGAERR